MLSAVNCCCCGCCCSATVVARQVGDIVERHLEEGDVVLFNCQPTTCCQLSTATDVAAAVVPFAAGWLPV
jgi:hypothetical protein